MKNSCNITKTVDIFDYLNRHIGSAISNFAILTSDSRSAPRKAPEKSFTLFFRVQGFNSILGIQAFFPRTVKGLNILKASFFVNELL